MADCSNLLNNPVGCGIAAVAKGQLDQFSQQAMDGANSLWNGFFTSWITGGIDGIVGGSTASWFSGIALPVQVFLLAVGLMVAGVRIALSARGEVAAEAGKKFLRAILISIAGVTFFGVMQLGANALAKSILDASTAGATPSVLWDEAVFAENQAMGMIFGILAVLAVGVQWLIMLLRAVAVTVLLPFWPVTAAGAMFDNHEGMFQKTTGWLIAFLIYSPVAAALYGLSSRFRAGRDGLQGVIIGMAIFALAIFALPALMRLVVPLTSAMGRASAGAMMLGAARTAVVAGVAAGSAVATAGASAPAGAAAAGGGTAAASGSAAASGGGAAATSGGAGATGATATGSSGAAGSTGAAGSSGAAGPDGGAGPGGGSGSGRSGWDAARDLAHAVPGGGRGVEEIINE